MKYIITIQKLEQLDLEKYPSRTDVYEQTIESSDEAFVQGIIAEVNNLPKPI